MRDGHARIRDLADLRDGHLAGTRLAATASHVAACGECAARSARVVRTLAAVAAGPLEAPPAAAVRSAARLFARAKWRKLFDMTAELVGRLVFDQRTALAPAIRGGAGEGRRVLWNLGAHELDLEIVTGGAATTIRGQILPAADAGDAVVRGSLTLWRDGAPVATTALDPEGAFVFRNLRSGTYAFAGAVEGRSFRVMPVVVGGAA
jgi:hypothetical protein